jgi:hypothetical protein
MPELLTPPHPAGGHARIRAPEEHRKNPPPRNANGVGIVCNTETTIQ